MPYAVSINEQSLDLIATNNGGLKPEIEQGRTYFVLPENPNGHAEILSVEDFFKKYDFVGPESDNEFRPIYER